MRNKLFIALTPLALLASALAVPADAGAANIGACGDINVEAEANCEVKVGAACTAECEPVNFTAACYADCSGSMCNASVDVECAGSCEASCSGQCEADPPAFSCEGSCNTQCKGTCSGECEGSNNQATCMGSCEANCEGECNASCEGQPGSATCDAKCQSSCNGSCTADANVDCQIQCQGSCTAELQGGCQVECEAPEGALFCDGQYIDHGGNLEECIAALEAALSLTVDVSARGSASCDGGNCNAEGEVSVGCAMAPGEHRGFDGSWLLVAGAAALGLARRRG